MRYKDNQWNLPGEACPGAGVSWDCIHTALMMDIRDELKEINQSLRPLRCGNFLSLPATLKLIARNTEKRKPGPKPKQP